MEPLANNNVILPLVALIDIGFASKPLHDPSSVTVGSTAGEACSVVLSSNESDPRAVPGKGFQVAIQETQQLPRYRFSEPGQGWLTNNRLGRVS